MSELINTKSRNANFRHQLLTNVSLLALMGAACAPTSALASSADEDRPTVWIELGGQLERVDTPQSVFAPAFVGLSPPNVMSPMVSSQRPSRYSNGAEGKITFLPGGTDWVVSAAIRYGKTQSARHQHYETPGLPTIFGTFNNRVTTRHPIKKGYGDGQANSRQSDFVLDFEVGKDIGLGMFGAGANSVVSAGVRYAQFTLGSDTTLHARPIYAFGPSVTQGVGKYHQSARFPYFHNYTAVLHSTRNTHAIGPAVSWEASLPVAGSKSGTMIDFDWCLNAAALFGRQRSHTDHRTTSYSLHYNGFAKVTAHSSQATSHDRSKSIFVPNVGGFAAVSLKFPNAKVSLGYRADFFFNATDNGIDARDAANQSFYGPFATISIGLGG